MTLKFCLFFFKNNSQTGKLGFDFKAAPNYRDSETATFFMCIVMYAKLCVSLLICLWQHVLIDIPIERHRKFSNFFNQFRKMKLSNEQCARVLGQLEARATAAHVTRVFGVNERTVQRLRQKFATYGTVADLPRSGRPRVTSLRQDRHIQLTHLRNRFAASNDTARNTPGPNRPRISARTVRRRLKALGLRCRRPYHEIKITQNHRRLRRQWPLRH